MSVMSCSRTGCDNIMCDTYVEGVGYICYECQEEFKNFACLHLLGGEQQIVEVLQVFMGIPKGTYIDNHGQINDFFTSRTR